MSAAANKALVRHILEAYAQADLAPLLDAIHPDVTWTACGPSPFYGFAGRHAGRAGVLAGMSKIATDYAMDQYRVAELIAEGDVVWMTANVEFTHRKSGTRMAFPLVSRWEMKDGQVFSLTEYFDSATLLLQEGKLIPAPAVAA